MSYLKNILNPEIFQGRGKKTKYFEGWYYKVRDRHGDNVFSIIAGVSYGDKPSNSHAFIQVITDKESDYYKFNISEFTYSRSKFEISIGENKFSKFGLSLYLDNKFKAELNFYDILSFKNSFFKRGIMGPFSYLPFMECRHAVVNIDCKISGNAIINGKLIDFNSGVGYIEKDWGRSFPPCWIWLMANNFSSCDVSFMVSVARVPCLGGGFTGIISYLKFYDKQYLFATYNGAKVFNIQYQNGKLTLALKNKNHTLYISATNSTILKLKAPKNGQMDRFIEESITAVIEIELINEFNQTVFKGSSKNSGMEVCGDISKLT